MRTQRVLILFASLALTFCGCASTATYHAMMDWPGGEPRAIDSVMAKLIAPPAGVAVIRSVAADGAFELYLRSALPKDELKAWLDADAAPAGVSVSSVERVRGALPAPPRVENSPKMSVTFDRDRAAAAGVTAQDVAMALTAARRTSVEASQIVVLTEAGESVPLHQVATVTIRNAPSHVVREY